MTGVRRRKPKTNDKVLRPVHPNAGIAAAYRKRLQAMIEEMNASVLYWLEKAYKANEPAIAQDELPANALRKAIRKLGRRWQRNFDEAAPKLADYFAQSVDKRSKAALQKILRDAGISVKFKTDRATGDVFRAAVNENVSLITNLPQQYITSVEGAVMRSIQAGRDLHSLAEELKKIEGVSVRRAALIARDQNNKATAQLTRARHLQLWITEAIWVHSGGGKTARPTHLKAGREKTRYDTSKGWFDPHEQKFIFPGELINCRCVPKPVIPGFS